MSVSLDPRWFPAIALGSVLLLAACGNQTEDAPAPAEDFVGGVSQELDEASEDTTTPGRWRPIRRRPDEELTAEQQAKIEELRAIGYAGGVEPARTNDVLTVHDVERAYRGLNFWNSGHEPVAFLMTMEGEVLHQWARDAYAIWPDLELPPGSAAADSWRRAYLYENGDVLAIFSGIGLVKLDAKSEIVWATENGAHHDLEVMPNGDIYVLTRTAHMVPRLHETEPVLEDFISVLGADGVEKKRLSLLEAFERSEFDAVRTIKKRFKGDIFHTNTLSVISEPTSTVDWLRPGFVITSMRYLDCVAVIDLQAETVVHAWHGEFARLHDPKLLPNGNILLFDNLGLEDHSRVMEIDPVTKQTVWEYDGEDEYPLSSYLCGAAERLPNGNTLISETDSGRAVELDPSGEVVWEFFNPFRVGEDPEYIATIFEMIRLPADFPVAWAHHQP